MTNYCECHPHTTMLPCFLRACLACNVSRKMYLSDPLTEIGDEIGHLSGLVYSWPRKLLVVIVTEEEATQKIQSKKRVRGTRAMFSLVGWTRNGGNWKGRKVRALSWSPRASEYSLPTFSTQGARSRGKELSNLTSNKRCHLLGGYFLAFSWNWVSKTHFNQSYNV